MEGKEVEEGAWLFNPEEVFWVEEAVARRPDQCCGRHRRRQYCSAVLDPSKNRTTVSDFLPFDIAVAVLWIIVDTLLSTNVIVIN